MPYKGVYKPRNSEKYAGDINKVVYRSLWERRLFTFLDDHPDCLQWVSEEIIIPYLSPVDKKWHKYFPDVLAKIQTREGPKMYLIEVKPFHQCMPPKIPKRRTKNYFNECNRYVINQAKFEAAKKYCDERGWKFQLVTEMILHK
jgi:TnsA endonuclease N terminal